jgi:DNA-binding NtrC family response regulator
MTGREMSVRSKTLLNAFISSRKKTPLMFTIWPLPDLNHKEGGAIYADVGNFREARSMFEREYIIKKINENNGNISKTAEAIGLERSYLHRKIKSPLELILSRVDLKP